MWSKSPSSQSRASRKARQCPTVWTKDPDLRPQTRQSGIATLHSAPIYVGPRRSGQSLPPPARLSRGKVRATVHYSQGSARAGRTVIHRISVRASGSCRGLRPCLLCHLCPATATAIAVAASCPKQHRPADERPLQHRCEVQRHHPREQRCLRRYIYISLRDGLPPVFNYIVLLQL